MKKNYMLVALLCAGQWAVSQNQNFLSIQNQRKKLNFSSQRISPSTETQVNNSFTSYGTVIGNTSYDLQSNYGAGSSRIIRRDDGTISAVWIQSLDFSGTQNDRGTGYNIYNPVTQSWGPGQTNFYGIASFRSGWPQILDVNLGELVLHHNSGAAEIALNQRDTVGMGGWGFSFSPGFDGMWPQACNVGDTVHMITLNNQNSANGITNPLEYHRSVDAGMNWDIIGYHNFPDYDASNFNFPKMDGDAYAIDAYNNHVAFVVGGGWNPLVLYKSDNWGATGSWVKTVIFSPDSSNSFEDTINNLKIVPALSSDLSIVLDASGKVHLSTSGFAIAWWNSESKPQSPNGEQFYYPLASLGVYYWNESMATIDHVKNDFVTNESLSGNVLEPVSLFHDYTGDNQYNVPDDIDAIGQYNGGISGQSTISIDQDSGVFIIWSQVAEIDQPITPKLYRDLYFAYSFDNGANWSNSVNIAALEVADDGFTGGTITEEDVFPSAIKRITSDDKLHMFFQSDYEPGMHVQGDLHSVSSCDMVYYPIDINYFRNLSAVNESTNSRKEINVFPNPTNDIINVSFSKDYNKSDYYLSIMNLIGQELISPIKMNISEDSKLDLSNLSKGIYLLKIDNGTSSEIRKIVKN